MELPSRPGRDLRFLLTLVLSLVFMAIVALGRMAGTPEEAAAASGARKVDAVRLQKLLDEKVLSDREALFSRPAGPAGPRPPAPPGGPR